MLASTPRASVDGQWLGRIRVWSDSRTTGHLEWHEHVEWKTKGKIPTKDIRVVLSDSILRKAPSIYVHVNEVKAYRIVIFPYNEALSHPKKVGRRPADGAVTSFGSFKKSKFSIYPEIQ